MRNLYIGDLQIHDSSGPVNGYWLQEYEGFDSPEYRTSSYDKPGEDGMVVTAQYYSGRNISLAGVIKGDTLLEYEDNKRALLAACGITRSSTGIPVPVTLTFETLSNREYFVTGHFKRPVFRNEMIGHCKFLLQFITNSPFVFSSSTISSGLIGAPIGGGFTLPTLVPIVSSPSSGGTVNITNPGHAESPLIIRLDGQLTDPRIISTATGKSMELDYTIASGDFVTIDMANKTILLNDTSTLLSTKTDTSDWFSLMPGDNLFTLRTSTLSDTGTFSITSNAAYLGV